MANELLYPQGFINAINNIPTSAPTFAFIHVTYPEGSICTAESSDGDFLAAEDTSGEYTFAVPEPVQETATWTISCSDSSTGNSDELEVIIDSYGQNENAILKYADPILNNNEWQIISSVAKEGKGNLFWDIGDCKQIILNGNIGDYLTLTNYTTYVYILDFNHPINKTTADNNIIWGGFKTALTGGKDVALCDSGYNSAHSSGKYFSLNHIGPQSSPYNTNYGGWKGCDFRYDILGGTSTKPSPYNTTKTTSTTGSNATQATIDTPVANTLMAALPSDLRAALRLWNRYVDYKGNSSIAGANCSTATVDALSLLAEFEIFGSITFANQYEQNHQKQMAYYSAGNSKIKYKHNATGAACFWWEASANCDNASYFCSVNTGGSANYDSSRTSRGLAPAFKT